MANYILPQVVINQLFSEVGYNTIRNQNCLVFGPNYHHFREAQGLIDAGAARSIKDYPELEAAFATALERHEEIGRRAAEYVTSELGATAKIYKELF